MSFGFSPTFLIRTIMDFQPVRELWWFWLFIVLFFVARGSWRNYIQTHYKRSIKWVFFELRIPRELRKSPRAMEQIFMSIHGVRNSASNIKEEWWDGEVTMWFSCEIVSFGGELHFYMLIPEKHRNIIEAAIYAQYPDVEVAEVKEDYVNRFPSTFPELRKRGYELFGNELILAKPDAYPIRTHIDFETIEEERQLDPVATILETISRLKSTANVWIQILIRPKDDSWRKGGEKFVKELKEKVGRRQMTTALGEIIMVDRSPGELEMMKAVERNIAKPGFDTLIRYIYIAPKDKDFDEGFARRGVFSSFNQYASEATNKFKHNTKVWTRTNFWFWPHIFPKSRKLARQTRIYDFYRRRKIYDEAFTGRILDIKLFHWGLKAKKIGMVTLNVEELATIFHPPTAVVLTGPLIKRVEARKVGPPAGLPIYGEKGEGLPEGK